MKKKIIILVCIMSFLVLAFISMIISVNLTGVFNPISSVYNISKVTFDEYMRNDGYEMCDRMGSIITYKNEVGNERRIHFSVNKYYALWEWI